MSDSQQQHDTKSPIDVWDDSRITAYVMGELSAEEASQFESAMQADGDLQAAVDAAHSVTGQVKAMFAGEEVSTLDRQRRESILASQSDGNAEIDRRSHETVKRNGRGRQRLIATVLLAAAAAIVVSVSVMPAIVPSQYALRSTPQSQTNSISDQAPMNRGLNQQNRAKRKKTTESLASDDKLDSRNLSGSQTTTWELNQSVAKTEKVKYLSSLELSMPNAETSQESEIIRLSDTNSPSPLFGVPQSGKDLSGPKPNQPISDSLASEPPANGSLQKQLAQVDGLAVLPRQSRQPAEVYFETRGFAGQGVNRPNADWYEIRSKRITGERILDEAIRGDRFDPIVENGFVDVTKNPLSTVSVDVDTASYSKVRRVLSEGRLPSADAVRIEEMVNYFDYQYNAPGDEDQHPFSTDVTITQCPWNTGHRLARIALQGKRISTETRPQCNLVFLLDVSGSMNRPNKLPLVVEGMKMLTSQLHKDDRVAIVVYAGAAGLVLDSTPARKQKKIMQALSQLSAGGSTAGGDGIKLAYSVARDHFLQDGVNRVILCTDGDFNVGISDTDQLVELITEEAADGIFLTALGFGMGNHNDAMLEQISGKGNGNYAFIDTVNEARKVLVRETDATLVTIAKDVKLQIEFNPRHISKYRLIGYENRVLAKEDFLNDEIDAGEIGAGHQVTALYELVPVNNSQDHGEDQDQLKTKPLRYQQSPSPALTPAASRDESLTVNLRYKLPTGDDGIDLTIHAKDGNRSFNEADSDFRFAAAVASFGMQLRNSKHAGDWNLNDVKKTAQSSLGEDEFNLRSEFIQLVKSANNLKGN